MPIEMSLIEISIPVMGIYSCNCGVSLSAAEAQIELRSGGLSLTVAEVYEAPIPRQGG